MKLFNIFQLKGFILILTITVNLSVSAQNLDAFKLGNNAYEKAEYTKAINYYKQVLDDNHESSEVYFNLGNAYFKNNNIALAILNYERAQRILPENQEIKNNLQLANQKVEDEDEATKTNELFNWKEGLSEKKWSIATLALFLITVIAFSFYIISVDVKLKKASFFTGVVTLLFTVFSFVIAKIAYDEAKKQAGIIMAATVTVNGEPNQTSTKLFVLHAGTKVRVKKQYQTWLEIELASGNTGWVEKSSIEVI